jgi:microcystin-dependent protein
MSYTINNFSVTYPVGSICPYGGSSDPNGWIICNELQRDWDDKYQSLIDMSIGAKNGEGTKYIPPDLRKYTMIGTDTTANLKTSVGNVDNSYAITEVPKHTHNAIISDHSSLATHTHTYSDYNMTETGTGDRPENDGRVGESDIDRTTSGFAHNHTSSASDSIGSGTSFSILNKCYVINWILKY